MSQVLARKYRPRNFQQLVGQDHVAQALTNALTNDRLHHAYLFVGTRGVGKTSIARILARCLNCETGVTATPCLTCGTCQSIEAGRFIDLIEVDAASRTKVEDTRELLENVQYAPSEGRFKVYLIDEVHMLSTSSFNALLKTLEEPPAHVKFLLATTDPQRVPMTVLSRCLQFRLRDLPADDIASHLANVLMQEAIEHDAGALQAIGQAARGSIRDAMTLTDQAIAFSNGNVTLEPVRDMLGIHGQDAIPALLRMVAAGDAPGVMNWVAQVAEVAPQWGGLIESLQRALHAEAVAQTLGKPSFLAPEETQLYYQIATQAYQDLSFAPEERIGF
ncbi:MAG: DNA polymerase III subunit gamma/tau, partial [Litorivicinus sp.]